MELGTVSEVAVMYDAASKGFNVAIPVHDDGYDLIIERNGNMYRVQVKKAKWRKDENTDSSITVDLTKTSDKKYEDDEFDIFAAHHPETEQVFYADWQEIGKRRLSIVVEDEENLSSHQKAKGNFPEDFTLEKAAG